MRELLCILQLGESGECSTWTAVQCNFCSLTLVDILQSNSHLVHGPVGTSFVMEKGCCWLASIQTNDLQMFSDFQIFVAATIANLLKIIEGPQVNHFQILLQ